MKDSFSPSVALVYDRVNTPYGGAEKVLLALHAAFPAAPLFTSVADFGRAPWSQIFDVQPSFLQRLTFARTRHRALAGIMPLAFESLNLSDFDIVLSVTSAEAKGVLTQPGQLHVCYLLTPPRYLYDQFEHSLNSYPILRLPLVRQLAQLTLGYLRWWDQAAIFRPDAVIPISQRVAKRARQAYPHIPLEPVLYPPVDSPKKTHHPLPAGVPQKYFLIISRLVSYKSLETAVEACQKLSLPLVIVGTGPAKNRLKSLVYQHRYITFLDSVSADQLAALYQHCRAVLMPGEEDFGIVALEANSYGKPVLINAKSGAAELITPGVHGLHIPVATSHALEKTLQEFVKKRFFASKIRQNPVQYQTDVFIQSFRRAVQTLWQQHQKHHL